MGIGFGRRPSGYARSAKLAEFRDNNRRLNATNADLEARLAAFEGIDPEAARAALANPASADTDKVAELETKLAAAVAEVETLKAQGAPSEREAQLAAELAAEKTAHAESQFRNIVSVEFLRGGGRESAVDYMVQQAAKTFQMKDGKVTTAAFSTEKPGEALTVEEWVSQQRRVMDFAFFGSRGGGARGNANGVGATTRTVSRDPLEFGRNLSDIASGKATVEG